MKPEKTITTYETLNHAFIVLQYGFSPVYIAYRVKNYKMRSTSGISTASLQRLNRLLETQHSQFSDTGELFFSTVHYY